MTTSDGPTEPFDGGNRPDAEPTAPIPPGPAGAPQGPPPPPPLSIVHIDPAQGTDHAHADAAITVRFSAAVAQQTLTTDTFQLYRQGTDVPIPATVRYDPQTLTATLTPASSLEQGAAYTAVVRGGHAGVAALSGPPLPEDAAWSFTTKKGSSRGLLIGIIVAVLAVAAILVAVFAFRGDDSPTVQPETIDFGDQALGARSGARDVQVTNPGSDSVTITTVRFAGANAGDFVLGGARTCAPGTALGKDASCTVGVSFAPTTQGERTANLDIGLDDGSTLSVALSGTGTGQAVAVASTTQLTFGSVTLGGAPSTQQANITNTGNAPLPIEKVSVTGANAGDFAIAKGTTCVAGTPVPAGGRCVVAVTFTPAQTGARSAAVTVAYDGQGSPLEIALSGTGEGQAEANLTPAQADFGDADVGTTGAATTFTLSNTGSAELPITAIALQGTTPRAFLIATSGGTCREGSSVATGASCTIQVAFSPIAAGAASASLTVVASGQEWSAPLTGTGVAAPATTTGATP